MKLRLSTFATLTSLGLCAGLAGAQTSDGADDRLLEALLRQEVQGPSRYAQSLFDAPAAVAVLGGREARDLGHVTVGDMLSRLPGVYLTNSRTYSAMGLRGFNRPGDYNSRVLMAIDGMRVNDAIYDQGLPQLEFPLVAQWVKRVELVLGPGSSIYGSNALLGVVNVVTVDGADAPGLAGLGSVGQQGERRVLLQYGSADFGGGDLFIGVDLQRSRGENLYLPELGTADGWVRGLDGESYASLLAKYRLGPWRAALSAMQRDKDAATAPYGTAPGVPGTRFRDSTVLGELAYDDGWRGELRPTLRLNLAHYEFDGDYAYAQPQPLINRDESRATWGTLEGRLLWRGLLNHEQMLGAELRSAPQGMQRNFDVAPYRAVFESRAAQHALALYAQDQWRWSSAWQLTTGLRTDRIHGFAPAWSPRATLVHRPDEQQSLKLIWARAFRVPNLYERFYEDGGVSQIANPALRPERLESTEIAWERVLASGISLSLNAYATQLNRLIEAVPLSDAPDAVVQYRNVGRVRLNGVDLGLEQRLAGGWQWRTSLSLLDARDAAGEHLSNSPHWLYKGHVITPSWSGWTAGAEWLAMGRRQGRAEVPVSAVLNLNLRYRIDDRQSLALHVANALDRHNFDPSTPDNPLSAIPQPGRSLRLDWQVGF